MARIVAACPAAELERRLNNLSGAVCNGVFALRPADRLLPATPEGMRELRPEGAAPA